MGTLLRNPRLRRLVRWVALAVLVAFWGTYLWQNASLLLTNDWSFDPWVFAAALVLATLAYGAYGLAWHRSFRAVGGQVPAALGLRRWYQSLMMKYTPGGVWHIAGRAWLLNGDGQSVHRALLSAVVEQGLTANAALVVAGAGLLVAPLPPEWLLLEPLVRLGGLALLAGTVALTHPAVFRRWTWIASWPITLIASRTPLAKREPRPYDELFRTEMRGLAWRTLLGLQAIYLGGMVLAALSMVAVSLALGVEPRLALAGAWAAFAISWLAGYVLLVTPGGLGAREAILVVLLEPLLGPVLALAVALLSRIAYTGGELIAIGLGIGITQPLDRGRTRPERPDPALLGTDPAGPPTPAP